MRLHHRFVALALAAPLLAISPSAPATSSAPAAVAALPPVLVHAIRETPTADIGLERPSALAWSPGLRALLVADGRRVLRLAPSGRALGTVRLASTPRRSTLAVSRRSGATSYLAGSDLVTYQAGSLRRARPVGLRAALRLPVGQVRGAAYDARGRLVVLDGTTLVQRGRQGGVVRTAVPALHGHDLVGLTPWPGRNMLFTYDRDARMLVGVRRDGSVARRFDLRGVHVGAVTGLAIAPSADHTDHRSTKSLYLADSGSGARQGRLVEVSLAAAVPPAAAAAVSGSLVRSVRTSTYSPPSPDPSGIGYLPDLDRFVISDGEVEEMSIFAGVNLWETTRTGTQTRNGVSQPWSNEPTGVGYNPVTRHLIVSDDSKRDVFDVAAGADGRYGSSDDTVTSFDTLGAGNNDPEGVAYDQVTGSVWTTDGLNAQVYRYRPGPDGTFGTADDLRSNFDTGVYGAGDPEGIDFDAARDTLVVLDDTSDTIYELDRSGALVNTISTAAVGMRAAAGIAVAPGSGNPDVRNYFMVDRGVDNDSDPTENDGMLYELAAMLPPVGPGTNQPPAVTAGPDLTVTMPTTGPASASLDGTVTDDGRPNPPGATTATWAKVSGFGDVVFANPNAVDTSASFSAAGTYVLRLTASDSQATGADEVTVVVRPAGSGTLNTVEIPVAASSDDAEQGPTGGVDLTSSDLELVTDGTKVQRVGLRFANLQVPAGASITRAWIQFQTDEVSTDVATLTLRAEATDNATTYLTTNSNLSNRALTTASVAWSPPAWSTAGARTTAQQTPDMTALVQAVTSRPGWAQGNALAVQITGTGRRTAEAFDGTAAPLLHVEFTSGGTPTNQAPAVSAGPDRAVTLPASASLDGTVSDDGLPSPPGATTATWSKVSGPGTVTFGNPAAIDTTASFSTAGTYVLRLSATDSTLTTTDDVTVVANPMSQTNVAPAVNAGTDQTVTLPASASLDATVTDDGLPNPPGVTTATWSKVSGPGTVTFGNSAAIDTTASFSTAGTYVLRLSATDTALTAADEVAVTVGPASGGGVTTIERSVASGSDDAEQRSTGGVDLTSSDLELVTDRSVVQRVGLRFANLQVPVGATVTRAWIQFQTDEVSTDVATLTLRAEATDNATTYRATNGNLGNRALTTTSVAWSPPAWSTVNARTAAQQTPDIAALVQAVTSRPGWAQGNALAVQLTGTGRRTAEAFEGTFAPLLHIEYSTGASPVSGAVEALLGPELGLAASLRVEPHL